MSVREVYLPRTSRGSRIPSLAVTYNDHGTRIGPHLRRCMSHEDVAKQFTKQEQEEATLNGHGGVTFCDSFQELQEETDMGMG